MFQRIEKMNYLMNYPVTPVCRIFFDVMCFLEEKGITAEKYCDDMGSSRIETWR